MPIQDYYGDGGDEGAQPRPGPDTAPKENPDKDEMEGQTALIPKSLCPGMEVGDEVKLKVVGVHEDELEVAYEGKGEEGKSESESEPEPKPMPMRSGMSDMME